jgi:phosphate acetyltransferase
MTPNHARHTLFIAPTSAGYGASAITLGLIRAYQREGYSVGFAKPVSDVDLAPGTLDRSIHFARSLCGLITSEPIPAARAEEMIRSGNEASLLEEIVAMVESTRNECDVVIVEGMAPNPDHTLAADLDVTIARNLSAEVIVVVMCVNATVRNVIDIISDAAHRYSGEERRLNGAILVRAPVASYREEVAVGLAEQRVYAPLLGVLPYDHALTAPRLIDVANDLELEVERHGNINRARVSEIVVAARGPEQLVTSLRPGTLVVTPGDRSDLVLTAALAHIGGMPIAGLLLTCGESLSPEIDAFLSPRFGNMPILKTKLETFDIAQRLTAIDWRVTLDDRERMDRVMDFVADHLDLNHLTPTFALATSGLMSPPMFRHHLMQEARSVARRIVLPEGDEPRTIHAAVICATKGIARCVLLGEPQRIRSIALTHGIDLPENHEFLEILDPASLRDNYVALMVARRKSKGMTAHQAEKELEDSVVLGTMMLAEGHVDGMVSGAVHTTASTVRPALQLIKTAPGSSIVSSVFFMLMPDQVLVYGDCAVNPNPTAEQLAEIAIQSADSAAAFGIEPRVAMISYSTGVSGTGDDVDKVRAATALVRQLRPDLVVDGPIQYDAASVESVGYQKAPRSPLHGNANVFIFPDLNTGNTTYKAVQRSANVVSVGPMLQGLKKPVNDLSRGALVDDIVFTIALTAIQAGQGG